MPVNSLESFQSNQEKIDAVVRNFEVIGEAVGNLEKMGATREDNLELRKIIGLRNKIAHEYFGIETGIIWKTAKDDLPILKMIVEDMLSEL